ncbi:unnamed protein product [Scytosiphon promiscuus]
MKTRNRWSASARLACAIVVGASPRGWTSAAHPGIRSMALASSEGGGVVAKTAVSTQMRLVFVLGLEGAGHHYFTGAREDMFRANPNLPEMEDGFPGYLSYFLPFIMGESAATFEHAQVEARTAMRDLAQRAVLLPSPGTFHLLRGRSVPTGNGNQKVMQYVDPRLMAEAAEAEGVDFRVLYLKRSAKELLLADTVHRHFQNRLGNPALSTPEKRFMESVRILFTDVAVVQSFLAELDPAFVVCHDWKSFGDPEQAQNIASFVAPNADVASMVKEALVTSASGGTRHATNETLPFDDSDVLSSRIQQKLDSFEKFYCSRGMYN